MSEHTKRVAYLEMHLNAPISTQKTRSMVSPQQWYLMNAMMDMNHPSHTHKVKQTEYTLLHTAKLESDQTEMAVYIDGNDQVWVRPMSEFIEKFAECQQERLFLPYHAYDSDWDDEDD